MMDLVVNYNAKSLETTPRLTEVFELYPYEIQERIRSEEFIDFEPGMAVAMPEQTKDGGDTYHSDKYAPHLFLEQHCFWDLDGDGLDEPYVVTIHKSSQKVVRVTARYEADGIRLTKKQDKIAKIEPLHYYTLFQFMPNPESSIYGHGFGHILGPINESINSAINQMFDAGTLQNLQAGFIGSGLSLNSGALRWKMGELRPVNTTGGNIRDNIYMLDMKGPSVVMFQMFGLLVEAGRQLAGIGNIATGQQSPASTDPATMMAMIEQGTKVFRGVYKRVLRGLNAEYAKLFDLNRKHMPEQGFQWQRADEQFDVTADDYQQCAGVETVGDPSLVTDIQRLARAQMLAPFKDDPRCNGQEILRRIFQAGNIEDIDAVLIENPQMPPLMQAQLQKLQAELATDFANQQRARAQSVLYLMQAKKFAADADAAGVGDQLDRQLEAEWVEIERNNSRIAALNTTIKAHEAAVSEKKVHLDHHAKMTAADAKKRAKA
jgi:chaperonin GroES